MNSTRNTTTRIQPGTLVAINAMQLNGIAVEVLPDWELDKLVVTTELADAGWQIARFRNTGCLTFVRSTGEFKWVGNTGAIKVEIASVDTGTVEVEGSFAIVAIVSGNRSMGWTRDENVR